VSADEPDWTRDPETGLANSSPEFERIVGEVERLIRDDSRRLIAGRADATARLIVAQLAHTHGLAPFRSGAARLIVSQLRKCPQCGWRYDATKYPGLVPAHPISVGGDPCAGIGQIPRGLEDRRPLWSEEDATP
jgi:hypothetical protein